MDQYLTRYAEPEIAIATQLTGPWDEAVIVPLYEEVAGTLVQSLAEAAQHSGRKVIAIFVVNARDDSSPSVHSANETLLQQFTPGLRRVSSLLSLYVIDRATPGRRFPPKQGVGLARKLGGDLALALHRDGKLHSPYFSTTDGDARVAPDYFELPDQTAIAFHHRYRHEAQGEATVAHELYEISLRYYARGLAFAGSPYAFPTIGSTLTVRLDGYAMVRGFPKLLAAEDFYLLAKLAKLGTVAEAPGMVWLKPRKSDRVPFGTGAATAKIVQQTDEGKEFQLYHPKTFLWLKRWLEAGNRFVKHRDLTQVHCELGGDPDSAGIVAILEKLGAFDQLVTAAKTRPNEKDLSRHLPTAFDAFKTLRFVHEVRDTLLPTVEYRRAMQTSAIAENGMPQWEDGLTASPSQLLERWREL